MQLKISISYVGIFSYLSQYSCPHLSLPSLLCDDLHGSMQLWVGDERMVWLADPCLVPGNGLQTVTQLCCVVQVKDCDATHNRVSGGGGGGGAVLGEMILCLGSRGFLIYTQHVVNLKIRTHCMIFVVSYAPPFPTSTIATSTCSHVT